MPIKPERERGKRHPGQQEIRAIGSRRRKGQQARSDDHRRGNGGVGRGWIDHYLY